MHTHTSQQHWQITPGLVTLLLVVFGFPLVLTGTLLFQVVGGVLLLLALVMPSLGKAWLPTTSPGNGKVGQIAGDPSADEPPSREEPPTRAPAARDERDPDLSGLIPVPLFNDILVKTAFDTASKALQEDTRLREVELGARIQAALQHMLVAEMTSAHAVALNVPIGALTESVIDAAIRFYDLEWRRQHRPAAKRSPAPQVHPHTVPQRDLEHRILEVRQTAELKEPSLGDLFKRGVFLDRPTVLTRDEATILELWREDLSIDEIAERLEVPDIFVLTIFEHLSSKVGDTSHTTQFGVHSRWLFTESEGTTYLVPETDEENGPWSIGAGRMKVKKLSELYADDVLKLDVDDSSVLRARRRRRPQARRRRKQHAQKTEKTRGIHHR